jgi:hypothetical protein
MYQKRTGETGGFSRFVPYGIALIFQKAMLHKELPDTVMDRRRLTLL